MSAPPRLVASPNGREFDNIVVTAAGAVVSQLVPYSQDFASGLPASPEGYSEGMPSSFGSANATNCTFSIYASYIPASQQETGFAAGDRLDRQSVYVHRPKIRPGNRALLLPCKIL
ncbi:hypothetical protein ACFLZ8_00945 [Planctomycetota bacterium]